eukprot:GDKI01007690.1.p2 GENE.GDKI01007690.1~~GDKI01007690.1.p2  ORF type:complete len:118 (-),score=20.63 GDKI01007690.1:24-377(-)
MLPDHLIAAQMTDTPVVAIVPALGDRQKLAVIQPKTAICKKRSKTKNKNRQKKNRPIPLRILQRQEFGLDPVPPTETIQSARCSAHHGSVEKTDTIEERDGRSSVCSASEMSDWGWD